MQVQTSSKLIHGNTRPGLFLLIVPPQMLHIPRMLQFSPFQGLKVVRSLPFTVDNSVGFFPIRAQFPMSWVFGCQRDLFQDKISYVETPWLHHCIILPSHEVFVPCCPMLCISVLTSSIRLRFKRSCSSLSLS